MMVFGGCPCPKCKMNMQVSAAMGEFGSFGFPGTMVEKTYHKKFSAGKAVVGVALTGGLLGAAAGAFGKDVKYYQCLKCGFTCDSNGNPVNF